MSIVCMLISGLLCLSFLGSGTGFSVHRYQHKVAKPHARNREIFLGRRQRSALNAIEANSYGWANAIGIDSDLNVAVKEAVDAAATGAGSGDATIAMFFVSTIFEASAFKYNTIVDYIREKLPNVKHIIGCTTGCPVSSPKPYASPVEIEARASVSVVLSNDLTTNDVDASIVHITPEEMKEYIQGESSLTLKKKEDSADGGAIALLLATESTKRNLAEFLTAMEEKEGIKSFGGVASSVTSLHTPKLFLSRQAGDWERHTTGLAALVLTGDIAVQTVVARSCLPVGPMFQISKVNGNEVLEMRLFDPETGTVDEVTDNKEGKLSPLVHLDTILNELPSEQAFALKKELLVGAVPRSVLDVHQAGMSSILQCGDFYGQKPTAFDPLTGGITLSSMPSESAAASASAIATEWLEWSGEAAGGEVDKGVGGTFQFCIRDTPTARRDLRLATMSLEKKLKRLSSASASASSSLPPPPYALMMLGSMERGSRVFRYQHWEASQLYQTLQETQLESQVPVAGFFSAGSFSSSGNAGDAVGETMTNAAVMEADSVYALITKKSTLVDDEATASGTPGDSKEAGDVESSSQDKIDDTVDVDVGVVDVVGDVLTEREARLYNDESDMVIVIKRDPESMNPVRVGTMDYLVPEKIAQPSNTLESYVWDREREVDRMREQFQLTRALSQAKAAEGKFPRRSLLDYIRSTKEKLKDGTTPPVLLELVRSSPNSGKFSQSIDNAPAWTALLTEMAPQIAANFPQVVSLGTHTDTGTFKGQFDDLGALNLAAPALPIFCNDFVLYVYQVLRAKTCGAHAIKLMASVLDTQEMSYMVKIAKAVGITCIVVVSSKPQLIDVLDKIEGVEVVSVTSRNMRLWKVDAGKAGRILNDPEVQAAISAKRETVSSNPDKEFMVFQEGFASPEDVVQAKENGVDAVFLGEELLPVDNQDITTTLKEWMQ